MPGVTVVPEPTPNPNSVKFTLDRPVTEGRSFTYRKDGTAPDSPLAQALLAVEGVQMVFMLNNFITVTREPGADWSVLVPRCREIIEQHFAGRD